MHGFADAGFCAHFKDIDGRKSGFALGNLDFYMTPEFGDRIKSLFELTFEFGEKGEGVATDLERLRSGYTFSDELTVWAGRTRPYTVWLLEHGLSSRRSVAAFYFGTKMIAFEDQAAFCQHILSV